MSDRDEDQFEPVPVELIYVPSESLGQAPLNPAASGAVQGPNRGRTTPNSRHQRLCKVCRHPDRDLIEREFLHWRSPTEISNDYGIDDRASITRHACATGLYERRIRSVRSALERIIERAEGQNPNRNTPRYRGNLSD